MNINKNVITFAMCLAMFCPIKPEQQSEETGMSTENSDHGKFVGIEAMIVEEVAQEVAQEVIATINPEVIQDAVTITEEIIADIQEEVSKTISTTQASTLLEEFSENLTVGNKFEISNTTFFVDTTRAMNAAEEEIIETIGSELIDSAISTVANIIESAPAHVPAPAQQNLAAQAISQEAAITLLQQLANSLVAGSHFALNGTNYTVEDTNN